MKSTIFGALLAAAACVALVGSAHAGSGVGTVTIKISPPPPPPLVVVFTPANPSLTCNAPAGAVVSALSVTGGDGNPVTYTATGGDTTDFAVSGANVVVGPNGITSTGSSCATIAAGGTTDTVTVTASQN